MIEYEEALEALHTIIHILGSSDRDTDKLMDIQRVIYNLDLEID